MFTIEIILTLIAQIPVLMQYFVPGYLFLRVYGFVRFKKFENNYVVISSITASYMLYFLSLLTQSLINPIYASMILAIVLGYACARIVGTEWFDMVFQKLRIMRTVNSSIWTDVLKDKTWLKIYKGDLIYFGQFKLAEEDSSDPKILLRRFRIRSAIDNSTIVDFTTDGRRTVLVDIKDMDRIEIIQNMPASTEDPTSEE